MDFGSVLYKAQKNEQNSRQNNGWYKTTFEPPKKETREKKLSANIQKFLAKKEEEEKLKRLDAERKRKELLELRNKDKKSFKRVKSMLTKTKSANKSVIEDAIDNVNTAVTANGPLQPDEDDYGYVSKDASELYNKLINKYSNMPAEESIFSKSAGKSSKDISSTKDRVKAALQREEEEKLLPRKRKRKSKTEGEDDNDDDKSDDEKINWKLETQNKDDSKPLKPEKFKIPKKTAQPPPIDFQSLLKLAEKKQHEPIMIEKKVDEKPTRPMTEKEKIEYLREKERRVRKEAGISDKVLDAKKKVKPSDNLGPKPSNEKLKPALTSSKPELSKKSQPESAQKPKVASKAKKSKEEKPPEKTEISKDPENSPDKTPIGMISERQKMLLARKNGVPIDRKIFDAELKKKEPSSKESRKPPNEDVRLSKDIDRNKINNSSNQSQNNKPIAKSTDLHSKPKINLQKSIPRTTETRRPFSPPARQFPPPDFVRRKSKPMFKRKVIESDDEYDSEMDDFIDDSEQTDVSKYISEIFGYDRNKYSNRCYDNEDSDECMESNFSELQKEEYISTKQGILEDLEDVRRTKLEKIRKKKRLMC